MRAPRHAKAFLILLSLMVPAGLVVLASGVFAQTDQPTVSPPSTGEPAAPSAPDAKADAKAQAKKPEPAPAKQPALEKALNDAFEQVNGLVQPLLMWDVTFGLLKSPKLDANGKPVLDKDGEPVMEGPALLFIVAFLATGAVFFTFWYGWINVRGFKHSINVIRGQYDNPADKGQISHFRALTSSLSATIGLGNIAGVAVAVKTGGPGAILWMMALAVFGMTAKFGECTLAQIYRKVDDRGVVSGGPMYYLDIGLKEKGPGWGILGKALAILFAVLVMLAALGGGNMFQANQSFEAFKSALAESPLAGENGLSQEAVVNLGRGFGIIMSGLVAAVILGGITRIGATTSRIVPAMCGLYVIASLIIIFSNITLLPETLGLIAREAFAPSAATGGFLGVMIIGFQRAAFSNEAGIGSAAIAHAAAKTDEPVREGIVAMIGPFIDTIIICLMTGLVVTITGAYKTAGAGVDGAGVTMHAFRSNAALADWFPYILSLCIILFAFSTMISWCYYGERGWGYLFGMKSVAIYRVIFVIFVFIGAVTSLGNVIDFSDYMLLSMAFPAIIGGVILCPAVKRRLNDYWGRYARGEMKPYSPGDDSTPPA